MRFLRKFLVSVILSGVVLPAWGAITYFGSASSPADTATPDEQDGSVARTVTPPASMQLGDLVYIVAGIRNATTTPTISVDGGQTWNTLAVQQGGASGLRVFWAQYDGTWDANPSISFGGSGSAATVVMHVFRPTSTSHTITVDVAQTGSSYSGPLTPFDVTVTGLTTLTNNALVIASLVSVDDNEWAVQTGGWAHPGANQYRNGTGSDSSVSNVYQIKATAGATGSVVNRQSTNGGDAGHYVIMAFKETAPAGPTFTSAPAIGTRTTNSIPINFTSDTTGTVYAARLTDGSAAPTCDQLEAQTAPGGVQYWSEAVVATVADSHTFSSITDGTVTDGYFCIEDGSGNDSSVASIADMYKLPAFTVSPSISAQDDNDYTISKTLDGPGTVHAVACKKDASAPTVAQVEAGTGGCTVQASANDDATGTFTLGGSLSLPIYDIYVVGTYGSQHEAAVHSLADEMLDAPAGSQHVLLTSVHAVSWCTDFNVLATPDIAAADVIRISTTTSPTGLTFTQSVDCNTSYTGSEARQSVTYEVYDTSAGDWMSGGPGTLWFNNREPELSNPDGSPIVFRYTVNQAITPDDLTDLCTDPEGDAISVTNVDALPTGLSITDSTLSGTPTAAGITDNVTLRCCDTPGDCLDF